MNRGSAPKWRWCVSCVVGMVMLFGGPLMAIAHPSDFETLTVDLLFGADGLEVIDGAVVETFLTYQPFPSSELRQQIAEDILAEMGLSEVPKSIDSELSERYHEVGFNVAFSRPLPISEPLQVDTGPLQLIADEANLKKLKLSVCSESFDVFESLQIDATSPGRDPFDSTAERPWCEIWVLQVDDAPIRVTVTSQVLPMTGVSSGGTMVVALALLALGVLILVVGKRVFEH